MTVNFGAVLPYLPVMLKALAISIEVTVLSFFIGSVLRIFVYLGRRSTFAPLRWLGYAFVEVFRNTPLLVQLYLIYFGLPQVGINLDPFWSTLAAMTLHNAASTTLRSADLVRFIRALGYEPTVVRVPEPASG